MSVKINVKLLGLTTWGARVPPFLWTIKMATETSRHVPCVSAMGLPEPTLEFYKYKQFYFLLQL